MINKKILNTVICYNNVDEVVEYARKLTRLVNFEHVCLVIVINRLDDDSHAFLETEIKNIGIESLICDPQENLGYMNGMIFGYESYLKENGGVIPNFVIMSNTDIDYPDNEILVKLLNNKYEDDIWVIGPAVFVPLRNSYDNPVAEQRRDINQINRLINRFTTPILNHLYIKGSMIKGKLLRKQIGNSRIVYEVHGCYFIIRGCMAEELVKRPFGALLYSEETYISEIAFQNRKKVFYDSDLLVNHIEHTVTGKIKTGVIARHLSQSMQVIKRDFYQ